VTDPEDFNVSRQRMSGAVVLGILLVAAGVALMLDRTGALPAPWRVSIWPVLLMGLGLARLVEPRSSGREGLFFVLAGAWWLACSVGWLSYAYTWPLLIVAVGASLVVEALTAQNEPEPFPGRRMRRQAVGGWLLPVIVLGAVLTSGIDPQMFGRSSMEHGGLRAVSVMGRRTISVPGATLDHGQMVVVMGENSLDLRQATIAPGSTLTVEVFGLMGTGIVTVPSGWIVDLQTTPVMGNVSDRRLTDDWSSASAPTGAGDGSARPRLVLRGTMIMGRLIVRS
jgi:hypothetical protein